MVKTAMEQIRPLMAFRGISQNQLARELGVNPGQFSRQMTAGNFRESQLRQIADVLGCEMKITFIDKESGKEFQSNPFF